ncbi:uncharacterized protein DUF397 [Lentzea atacamensis]|uniref:Uncharacterized protein DUF397 n=1 Tax=Lentzea atacamensis TaxID=531938 RepID=A0ABX9DWQ1_9PSEU|nr:DUF397 domain-containing protein [Lentzea atacamensis]RAS59717.1 uncharacterized protein DUF397 [Lentzea atacamensis]
MHDLTRARWRKSSYSSGDNNGQCVELAPHGAARDSKNPTAAIKVDLPRFIAAVKAGAFSS